MIEKDSLTKAIRNTQELCFKEGWNSALKKGMEKIKLHGKYGTPIIKKFMKVIELEFEGLMKK